MKRKFTRLTAALALLTFLIPLTGWGQAPVNTVLWGETWGTFTSQVTPSAYNFNGTTVYGGATLTYEQSSTNTKLYNENSAGGTAPELLLSKNDQTWTISGIPTGSATGLTLTFKANYDRTVVSSTTTGITIGTKSFSNKTVTYPITVASTVSTFTLVFTNTNSSNVRIDDIELVVTTAGGGTSTPTITFSGQGANLGIKGVGEEFTTSFTVSQQDLEDDITLTLEGPGSLSTDLIELGDDPTEVTWNYTPTTVGDINATITATSEGAESVTFTITGEAKAYHNVNIATGIQNGSVTASPTSAYESQYVTLTVTPAQGYELDELTVVDANNSPVTVNANNVFQMPDSDVTVNATFVEAAPTTTVTDVLTHSLIGVTSTNQYQDWSGKTSNSNAVYAGNSCGGNESIQLRSNNNNSGIVSTTSGGKVSKVTVTWNTNTSNGRTLNIYGSNTAYSAASDLYGDNAGTLLGTIAYGTSTELTISGNYTYVGLRSASGAMYLDEIDIEWTVNGNPAPFITADPVEIVYNATSGSIYATINNYVDGTMAASTEADWISNFTYDQADEIFEVDFTATANSTGTPRTATVTLTYTYGDNLTATKDVTITQTGNPDVVDNISSITGAGDYHVKGTVVATSSKGFIIGDGTGYVYTYMGNTSFNYAVDNKLSITGTTSTNYGHVIQFTDAATFETVEATNYNGDPQPEVITEVPNYSEGNHLSTYLQFEGTLSKEISGNYTNYNITVGEGTIRISYPTSAQVTALEALLNKTVRVQGFFVGISGTTFTAMMKSVEEVTSTEPTLTANPNSLSFTYAEGATEVPTKTFTLTGSNLTNDVTVSLPTGSNFQIQVPSKEWGNTWTLTPNEGAINKQISVCLKEDLTAGDYSDAITVDWQGTNFTVTLTGTVTNQTYTLTDESGDNGSISFSASAAEAGAHVTLTATPASDAYYFVPNSWSFFKDDLTVVTEDIEFVAGETNVIVMPAYNLHVDATFQLKQTYAITAVALPEAGGTVVTDDEAWEGKVVEIAVEANTGYALSSLIATYVDGNEETQELTITDNTFVMPAYAVTVTATFEENTEVTYDFTEIEGFDSWSGTYMEHVVEYPTATVTFASANHQTSTITDQPVTKGNPVIIVMKNSLTLTSAAFECTQWGTKAQTIEMHYSLDGGENFTSTDVTSDDFSISANLPAGTNAVKITFSSQDNQIGIASATVNIQSSDVQTYTLTLGNDDHINEYFMFVNTESESVEFDTNGEMEVYEGATVYVSVAEVEDCYLFNGINVVYGDNQKADTTKYDPMYYSFVMPAGDATLNFVTGEATQYTLTVAGSHFSMESLLVGSESEVVALDNNQAEICEQVNVEVYGLEIETGYVLTSVTLTYGEETVTVSTNEGDLYAFQMPSSNATLTFTTDLAPVADNYELFSGDLVEGDYIIYYEGSAMKNTVDGGRLYYETVTPNDDVITTDDVTIVWHIAQSGDYWTIYSADAEAYAAGTGVKNKAQMLADGTSDYALWTVSGTEEYEFVNKGNQDANVNAYLRNNHASNNNYGFACYASSTGGDLSLYKKVVPTATVNLEITGYEEGSEGGYYLIASPVTVDPATVDGMTEDDFDLYYFDQAEEAEWQNYKASSFNLEPGKGYLYAKQATTDGEIFNFELTGPVYTGDGMIPLTYDAEAQEFPGLNLIGNPFAFEATLDRPFYKMNANGDGFTAKIEDLTNTIAVMEGVFVWAESDGDTATFTDPMASSSGADPNPNPGLDEGYLNLSVNKTLGGFVDNAIVRFDGGAMLGKFQLRENSTKVYITENGKDYAIVRAQNEGEMPISFKAENNGTYTLSVEPKNVDMTYLHLIDNRTGADVDLLATPSYTFEANTTDYASRFRLVFNANSSNENETFAFFNGSEWMISNMGEATLQVVDVMGRVLSTETVNGNATMNLNQTPGVYMLRLVNGDSVKVQKVVVR